jgi:hypothetical protein
LTAEVGLAPAGEFHAGPDRLVAAGPSDGGLALRDAKPSENLLRPDTVSEPDDVERNKLHNLLDKRYSEHRRKENTEAVAYVFDMAAQSQKHRHLFDAATFSLKDVGSPPADCYAVKELLA